MAAAATMMPVGALTGCQLYVANLEIETASPKSSSKKHVMILDVSHAMPNNA